jgi:nitroreductase
MELREAILKRRTTNGHFRPDPVRLDHQHRLMEAAARAPSHFNSQPWRFVLITDPHIRAQVARIAGSAMHRLVAEGRFVERYSRYFRFDRDEIARGDGILLDHLPSALQPLARHALSSSGMKVLNRVGVSRTLGRDNEALVNRSPLLLAALLTRDEYQPDDLSGFYSLLGLGMAIENIWLTTVELGMGIQFISAPMEIPPAWQELKATLRVPSDLELMAVYRLGYLPERPERATIDWVSGHRKRLTHFVFRDHCEAPERDPEGERA